ncbi:MAG: hypothetical protein OEV64_07715 [Desulfobulbaceae bacterium]|nr:hypothetical protein [Desulfobulbaceae bacterium]
MLPGKAAGFGASLYAPYLRFKGNVFIVTEKGVDFRSVDTTQAAHPHSRLPPSLGLRPQAMELERLEYKTKGRYLQPSLKVGQILEKVANITELTDKLGDYMYHRAFIGETLSFIYLPMELKGDVLYDGVNGAKIVDPQNSGQLLRAGLPFNPVWRIDFKATLCPHCGGSLEGESDCLVLHCGNCRKAWEVVDNELREVIWRVAPGDGTTGIYLGFWRITGRLEAMGIDSLADFIEQTVQPMVPKPEWRRQIMSYWIPAFKLSPKRFLHLAKHVTLAQWRIKLSAMRKTPNFYPVTLPASEARQSVKITLAAAASRRRKIYALLPKAELSGIGISLVYLPFSDKGHDWVEQYSKAVVEKNVLHFGRSM